MHAQRIRGGALVGALLALAIAVPTAAADPPASLPSQAAAAGVEHARQAGILVDPAMVPLMEDAPIGTCENDPTLAGCPPIKAVVYSPEFFGNPPDPTASTASRRVRRLRAQGRRATARQSFLYQCGVQLLNDSPYKAAGYAQMNARSLCYPTVTFYDIYIELAKYGIEKHDWVAESDRWIGNVQEGVYKYWHLVRHCASTTLRAWQAKIHGYAMLNGVLYGDAQKNAKNLRCNT